MRTRSLTGRPRTLAIAALALALATMASMTASVAQSGEQASVDLLMTHSGVGTRSLRVTDLTGNDLAQLTLRSGQPTNYQAMITDLDYIVGEGFDLVAETGNLYPVTGTAPLAVDTSDDTVIPSGNVTLDLLQGFTASGVLADLTPTYLLNLASATCETALATTGLEVVQATLLCTQLALADTTGAIDDLPIVGETIAGLDLSALDLLDDLLGLLDGTLSASPFTDPSYLGLGSADPDNPGGAYVPTQLTLLLADAPTALVDELLALVLSQVPDVAGQAVTDNATVAAALQALADTGDAAVITLANTIGAISDTGVQAAVVNALFALTPDVVDLSLLDNLFGIYRAFPTLTATAPDGLPSGQYAGTHTVTLISR